jgi:ADP-heptose:LPS heptosyltransferase
MPPSSGPPAGPFGRILVLQQRQIGDVLLTTPALALLRRAHPRAHIAFFTEKKCAPVLEHNPDVDEIIVLDKKALPSLPAQLRFYRRVGRGLGGGKWDLVVDFQQLPRLRWIVFFAMLAAPRQQVRLSYPPPWYNSMLYTHAGEMAGCYAAEAKAAMLGPLLGPAGVGWNSEPPRIFLTDDEMAWAEGYLTSLGVKASETVVTIDVTHRRESRRWSARQWAALADGLCEARPEVRPLFLHGPGEEADARGVMEAMRLRERAILDRLLTLREMAAVQSRSAIHVGNCSSPRHFAVAVGTPTFIVVGSAGPSWRHPSEAHVDISLGLDCQPCYQNVCPQGTTACLRDLSPDSVLEALLNQPALAG